MLLLLAAMLNIGTVYFVRPPREWTRLWPMLRGVTILLTQFLVVRRRRTAVRSRRRSLRWSWP